MIFGAGSVFVSPLLSAKTASCANERQPLKRRGGGESESEPCRRRSWCRCHVGVVVVVVVSIFQRGSIIVWGIFVYRFCHFLIFFRETDEKF